MTTVESAHAVSVATARMVKLARSLRGHAPLGRDWLDIGSLPLLYTIAKDDHRVSELADLTHSDVSVVSRLVRQFEQRGLVTKDRDPEDGRAFVVRLTPAGETLVAELREERAQWLADLLDDWPAQDVAELVRLLDKFSETIDGYLRRSHDDGDAARHEICSLDVNK